MRLRIMNTSDWMLPPKRGRCFRLGPFACYCLFAIGPYALVKVGPSILS